MFFKRKRNSRYIKISAPLLQDDPPISVFSKADTIIEGASVIEEQQPDRIQKRTKTGRLANLGRRISWRSPDPSPEPRFDNITRTTPPKAPLSPVTPISPIRELPPARTFESTTTTRRARKRMSVPVQYFQPATRNARNRMSWQVSSVIESSQATSSPPQMIRRESKRTVDRISTMGKHMSQGIDSKTLAIAFAGFPT